MAIAVLKVEDQRFVDEISEIIKKLHFEITPQNLPNLVKASFHFKNDLYEFVHNIAVKKIDQIPSNIKKMLKTTYKDHKRISNSPFI